MADLMTPQNLVELYQQHRHDAHFLHPTERYAEHHHPNTMRVIVDVWTITPDIAYLYNVDSLSLILQGFHREVIKIDTEIQEFLVKPEIVGFTRTVSVRVVTHMRADDPLLAEVNRLMWERIKAEKQPH